MKKLCDFYIAKAGLIGALYCIVPTLIGYAIAYRLMPFREVYVLRLAIVLLVGAPVAAYLNRFGLSLWMIKHASPKGPATVLDGIVIGSFLGMGMAVIPSFVHCISSTDMDRTQTLVICIWLLSGVLGTVMGGFIASVGRRYLARPSGP